MKHSGRVDVRKEINVEISNEKDTYFLATFNENPTSKHRNKYTVEGVYIYDITQTEIISDESFNTVEEFLTWTSDLIEKLKTIKSEVEKLIQNNSVKEDLKKGL